MKAISIALGLLAAAPAMASSYYDPSDFPPDGIERQGEARVTGHVDARSLGLSARLPFELRIKASNEMDDIGGGNMLHALILGSVIAPEYGVYGGFGDYEGLSINAAEAGTDKFGGWVAAIDDNDINVGRSARRVYTYWGMEFAALAPLDSLWSDGPAILSALSLSFEFERGSDCFTLDWGNYVEHECYFTRQPERMITLSNVTFTSFALDGRTYALPPAPVPLPASGLLLAAALGLGGLALRRARS